MNRPINLLFLSLFMMLFFLSCLGLNVIASDQYLALVIPGKMFKKAYEDKGLAPENLSRTLEDSAPFLCRLGKVYTSSLNGLHYFSLRGQDLNQRSYKIAAEIVSHGWYERHYFPKKLGVINHK